MGNDRYIDELLLALDDAEKDVSVAKAELDRVEAKFGVAAVKFAALRDAATTLLGENPHWRLDDIDLWGSIRQDRGTFRYLRLPPAEAIFMALEAARGPASISDIVAHINKHGGDLDARAVNAAIQGLIKQGEVRGVGGRTKDDPARYRLSGAAEAAPEG